MFLIVSGPGVVSIMYVHVNNKIFSVIVYQIDRLMKEDEGVYQCHTANIAGEAHADGSITVLEQNKSKKEASLLAWDNSA